MGIGRRGGSYGTVQTAILSLHKKESNQVKTGNEYKELIPLIHTNMWRQAIATFINSSIQYSYTMHSIYNWGKSTIYAMGYRNLWKPSFVYSKLSHSAQQQKSIIPPPSYRILNLFNIFFVRTQARKALSVGYLSNFPAVPLCPKKWKVKFAGRLTVRLSLVLHTDWGHP